MQRFLLGITHAFPLISILNFLGRFLLGELLFVVQVSLYLIFFILQMYSILFLAVLKTFPTKAPPASQIIRDPEQKGHHLLTYQGVARASFASFVVGYPISFRCPDLQYIWENQGETKWSFLLRGENIKRKTKSTPSPFNHKWWGPCFCFWIMWLCVMNQM